MAVLTNNSSISATGLTYRGAIVDYPYTGSVVVRSILPECDGSLILFWERGVLIGQFWSTTRSLELLSDPAKLSYNADKTTVIADKSPIGIKVGKYFARFYPGSSAYYAHAAIRSSCGCGWCAMPCDRIWSVVPGSTIQSLHQTEGTLPAYDEWIPISYYLGVYGPAFEDARANGTLAPSADVSAMFTSKPRLDTLKTAKAISSQAGVTVTGGGGSDPKKVATNYAPLEVVKSDGSKVDFLDFGSIDFCADSNCDDDPRKPIPQKLKTCDQPQKKPQSSDKSGDCGCS